MAIADQEYVRISKLAFFIMLLVKEDTILYILKE